MKQYDKVCRDFGKLFNQEELKLVLSKKAETKQLEDLMAEVATSKDMKNCIKIIDQLYKRLRQLSIVMVETTRQFLPQKTSTSIQNEETKQG